MRFGKVIGVLIVLLFSIKATTVLAQNVNDKVWFFSKVKNDSVILRWHFNDANMWKEYIQNGLTMYRKDLSTNNVIKIDSLFRPFTDSMWAYYEYYIKDSTDNPNRKINEDVAIVLSMQHPEQFPFKSNQTDMGNISSENDLFTDTLLMRHFFHTMSTFSSKEAALVGGLYYVDKGYSKGKNYEYALVMGRGDYSKAFKTIQVYTGVKPISLKSKIVYDYTNRRMSTIKWGKIDTSITFVPFYNIYRSDVKDKGYVKINQEPQLALFANYGEDSLFMFYTDSTLQKDKTYYYKVSGIDIFGDELALSDPYLVKEVAYLANEPRITQVKTIGRKVNDIQWSFNDLDKENIKGFQVYRSEFFDSLYMPISPVVKLDVNNFRDEKPLNDVYYKVAMLGNAKDTLWSFPAYIHIPDSIAPQTPYITSAICDSMGVVTIKFTHQGEKDLMAYKIFKANHLKDEFSGVYMSKSMDTIGYDTISLFTTSKYLYYQIQLIDKSYNPSEFSNIVKVKRWDTIPPTSGVFESFQTTSKGIELVWANSSSDDVVKYILYKKFQDEMNWHQYKVIPHDSTDYTRFMDTQVVKGQWYEYRLQAKDDANNTSDYSTTVAIKAYDSGIRPELKNVVAVSNKKKKVVKLSWEYKERGVLLYQIFRGEDATPLSILQSIDGTMLEFYDKTVAPGKKYTYRIKAVFKDGGESPYSVPLVVEF